MKRYLVFAGFQYYPVGGMKDFAGDFDDLDEAVALMIAKMKEYGMAWGQVWDNQERELIKEEYDCY